MASPAPADDRMATRARPLWRRVFDGLRERNAFEAASSIAFRFFLALVPTLALAGWIIGLLARRHGVDAFAEQVLDLAPPTAEDLVFTDLDRMATHSGTALGPLSALVAVWLGASGVHHLMDVLETAHHAPRRAWWKQRLLGAAWVSAALVCTAGVAVGLNRVDFELRARIAHPITGVEDRLVPFATSVVRPHPPVTTRAEPLRRGPTLERSHPPTETPRVRGLDPAAQHRLALRREHRDRLRRALNGLDKRPRPPLEHALVLAILLLLTLAGLSLFYRSAVERPKGTRPRTLPGALVAAASGVLVSWLFGLYVGTLASYAVYYGSLAAVAVLMIWLLLASLALLLGAEVNAQLGANTPSNAANPPARA